MIALTAPGRSPRAPGRSRERASREDGPLPSPRALHVGRRDRSPRPPGRSPRQYPSPSPRAKSPRPQANCDEPSSPRPPQQSGRETDANEDQEAGTATLTTTAGRGYYVQRVGAGVSRCDRCCAYYFGAAPSSGGICGKAGRGTCWLLLVGGGLAIAIGVGVLVAKFLDLFERGD
mmetsp:Transcript_10505/g.25667  ORF Transcript_10505/g.25667 Transcript_10505/m.25667 type:complete len:175 (+) Transcript_10505:93-617(+)|eukprot:CAMPEP_0178999400 /NCGR_PEP_ID=MMETSP0795-20121207/10040_1 /TAXON_ID=88552 /ORGANISM="Amoebophrya sp., Strain Ameob2" /LENGTH=174 /DNA_ID=CAMNT_0020692171 /DNA_START=30 /DNA_END=554 /DNA_ORIENTATION=+